MLIQHVKGLFTNPKIEWATIRDRNLTVLQLYKEFLFVAAAIAPICALIGTTTLGWSIGIGEPVKLTFASALKMSVAFYIAILIATFTIGKLIHWMSETYGSKQSLSVCVALAGFTAMPLFLVGAIQLIPTLWLNFVVGLPALAYSVYLLFTGVPIMMQIPEERGFLFSSSILAVGLVTLVGLLAVTAGLWGIGVGPRFTG